MNDSADTCQKPGRLTTAAVALVDAVHKWCDQGLTRGFGDASPAQLAEQALSACQAQIAELYAAAAAVSEAGQAEAEAFATRSVSELRADVIETLIEIQNNPDVFERQDPPAGRLM